MPHTTFPIYSPEESANLFAEHFGYKATASRLPGECDLNFQMTCANGDKFVFKIYAPGTDHGWLDAQDQVLAHLAQSGGFPVPNLLQSASGETTAAITDANGNRRFLRALNWIEGTVWAKARETNELEFAQIGTLLGGLDKAMKDFDHPAAHRTFLWDIAQTSQHREFAGLIVDQAVRAEVIKVLDRFDQDIAAKLAKTPRQVIHNDANDYNLLVDDALGINGLIDFGDFIATHRICNLAVALAYAMMDQADPLARAVEIITAYHRQNPLGEDEVAILYELVTCRLAQSACMAAQQHAKEPENDYLLISQAGVNALLVKLAQLNPTIAHYRFRDACGWEPCPRARKLVNWLTVNADDIGPVIPQSLAPSNLHVVNLNGLSIDEDGKLRDASVVTDAIFAAMDNAKAEVGLGKYLENRKVYQGPFFETATKGEWRSLHLGIDLFVPDQTPVYAPLDGVVVVSNDNARDFDYGPIIILEHTLPNGQTFYTKYGHLSRCSLDLSALGRTICKGDVIGHVGPYPENGNWAPHLHFQIMADLLGMGADICGVAAPSEANVWASICPNPNLILGMAIDCQDVVERAPSKITAERIRHLGPNLSVSYKTPLKMVRGQGQYLYTDTGEKYLDMVNNVCHIGHAHPRVVDAAARQAAALNTNTRYLHDNIVNYANELAATFPDPLSVCFFVNSGSEANDLALRLAQAYSGRREMLIVDHAYHGNLTSLIDLSPYKFNRKGGTGCPDHVKICPMPDGFRGSIRGDDPDCGRKYAELAIEQLRAFEAEGRPPAAFIAESVLGCGGQVVLPDGYLKHVYQAVRAASGLCIADEVQVGFGRVGTHMWGFELQDVVPDIVTLGKPIGNGHPLGAVITTREVANAFYTGMEYFNTFGGNPVSCAIGREVLHVIRDERLQANAKRVGDYMMEQLRAMAPKFDLIGEVRGAGLFIGIELIEDHATLTPATRKAGQIINLMKDRNILISTDGPLDNVIKIKPPITFEMDDAKTFLSCFNDCLEIVSV
jgi:4-aminobutyrate aminotransferase-like enzyme/Ser/Thr protein kinase RdoA (MazF antagonist)